MSSQSSILRNGATRFNPQLVVRLRHAPRLAPEVEEMLRIAYDEGRRGIDSRFPNNIVDEGLVGKAVHYVQNDR